MGRMVTVEAEEVGMVWTIVETTTVWVVVFVPAWGMTTTVVVSLGAEAEMLKLGGCHLERTLVYTVR
jgi:hypothetical protein